MALRTRPTSFRPQPCPALSTIVAIYNGSLTYGSSSDSTQILTITTASTTTAGANKTASFSSSNQNVTLSATGDVVSGGTANQGTDIFPLMNGGTNLGSAVTSPALTTGAASVTYVLPAGTPPGNYTIAADVQRRNKARGQQRQHSHL